MNKKEKKEISEEIIKILREDGRRDLELIKLMPDEAFCLKDGYGMKFVEEKYHNLIFKIMFMRISSKNDVIKKLVNTIIKIK
ncbi:MAG: hypothetical protein WC346_04470 [Methanogenium sp.]|jgi:hypothetical protein